MKKEVVVVPLLFLSAFLFAQNRYDVVIDEVMADPSPTVSLPNNEWVELRNTAPNSINLQGWKIGDASGLSGNMPVYILKPDSFVIVCSSGSLAAMSAFGPCIAVTSFPSLDNDADQIILRAANGKTIHAVAYNTSWYRNELKKDGGWTLEMIDPHLPCMSDDNWQASSDVKGGTPGKKNSVDGINHDEHAPQLKYTYAIDSISLRAVFDEPLDSLKAATAANYTVSNGLTVRAANCISPLFREVQLAMNTALVHDSVYYLTANNITDCSGNAIGMQNTVKAGFASIPEQSDVVINEILFDPRSSAYDYIEIFNRSKKIIDASRLFLANRNSSNAISSIRQISTTPFYLFPSEYIVVTENLESLELNYLVKDADAVVVIASLPSFPDDAGDAVLINASGQILDELAYKKNWQFKLIQDPEGVALERIDPEKNSGDSANWHSASSTAGYGTPGYLNSQYRNTEISNTGISIEPKIFSPDNDGRDDVLSIRYKTDQPGYVVNVIVYDIQGRPVKRLVRNAILGVEGYWNWDGLDEENQRLPIGPYIIYTELFNLQGKKEFDKQVVILARPLQ
jgi:hypothetical protein